MPPGDSEGAIKSSEKDPTSIGRRYRPMQEAAGDLPGAQRSPITDPFLLAAVGRHSS